MRVDTQQSLHFGINYVIAPLPLINNKQQREFQGKLAEEGIEFEQSGCKGNDMRFSNGPPHPLQVRVAQAGPQVGQLLVVAAHPNRPMELFIEEAGIVCAAFQAVWPGRFQIVARDCTIRNLYVAQAEHAFKYLWEQRLGQDADQLSHFGRTVLGGGLRFVMPPDENAGKPANIEVKIESYLEDSTRIYVDVLFGWPQPMGPGTELDPGPLLTEANEYADREVVDFILGGGQ